MHMKKIISLYVAYFTIAVLIEGCCGNIKCIPYVDLKGGTIRINVNGIYQQTGIFNITTDTLNAQLDFLRDFISYREEKFSLLGTAYAFKCNQCSNGESGLKDKVRNITLTGNQVYRGVAPGGSLNSFFKFAGNDITYGISRLIPLDSLRFSMNNNGSLVVSPFRLASGLKPGNAFLHKLNMKLEFESGKIINAPTPDFSWN
jgi:hypothetical protein